MLRRWPGLGFASWRRRSSLHSVVRSAEGFSHRRPAVVCRRHLAQHRRLPPVTRRPITHAVYRCKYCGHKSRHRNVAVRHVWRAHPSLISRQSNVDISRHSIFTSDDVSHNQTHARHCVVAVSSSTKNLTAPASVTGGILAAGDCTDVTARSSDTDEDRLYRVRLVPASASTDKSEIAAGSSLQGPLVNPERQTECFQAWPGCGGSRTCTSADHQSGERNVSSADWLCNIPPITAGSSLSCWPLLPVSVDSETLDGSGTDSVRTAAAGHSTQQAENTAFASSSFQKQVDRSRSKRDPRSCAAVRFACPQCSLSYKRAADLTRHVKQKHWTSSVRTRFSPSADCFTTTAQRETSPLNLTLNDARSSHQRPGCLHCDDTHRDLPLDLSVASTTLKWNGLTATERQFDSVTGCRSTTSHVLLPEPFIFADSLTKSNEMSSETSSSNFDSGTPSLSVSTMPSFYASFAKFMENTYKPLLKSYFDGAVGQNAAAALRSSENASSRRSAVHNQPMFSVDSNQTSKEHFALNNETTELSRSVTTTDNNNNNSRLKCDVTGRSKVSADAARPSVAAAVEDRQSGGSVVGLQGSWGQCPLCPFVCLQPLVMRRHLDVHDESEQQRRHACQTAAAPSTSVKLDAAARPSSFVDASGSRQRASTSTSSCATTSESDCTSGVRPQTSGTSSWLEPARLFPLRSGLTTTSDAGGRCATSWNCARGWMAAAQSAELQTVGALQTRSMTRDATSRHPNDSDGQPCDGSLSNERSSSATDVKKSFPEMHPSAAEYLQTPPWLRSLTATSWPVPPSSSSMAAVNWWCGWPPSEHPRSTTTFTAGMNCGTAAAAAAAVTPFQSFSPLSSRMHSADFKKLRRFCCSSCPYRSNFRSDVVRHIRHKHPAVASSAAGVSKLDPASAAATLDDYMNTWARKKFVLHSRRRRRAAQHRNTSTLSCAATSSSGTVPSSTPPGSSSGSGSSRGRLFATSSEVVVGGESPPRTSASEDRLVIDTEDEDDDNSRGHATASRDC